MQRLLRDGGGELAEDIPPAPPDERAAAAAEHDASVNQREREGDAPVPDMLIPGLELAPAKTAAPAMARPAMRRRTDPEAERLRAVLIDTLAELEAIRALLG